MKVENTSWLFLFMGATAMMVFSWYLMYIMVAKFVVPEGAGAICIYCIALSNLCHPDVYFDHTG